MVKWHKKLSGLILGLLLLTIFPHQSAWSQVNNEVKNAQIRAILRNFSNYRYSDITVYRVEPGDYLTRILSRLNPEPTPMPETAQRFQESYGALAERIRSEILGGIETIDELREALQDEPSFTQAVQIRAQSYIDYQIGEYRRAQSNFRNVYVVTTRVRPDEGDDAKIIALLPTTRDEEEVSNMQGVDRGGIRTYIDLSQPNNTELASLVVDAIRQESVRNVTIDAQGIDGEIVLARPVYGNTTPISEDNLQEYMRISEGNPNRTINPDALNEVIDSLFDLVSYRRYDVGIVDSSLLEPGVEPVFTRGLPLYGVEVRYGLEEINYPSIWSERLAVNALWGTSRLGVILPTRGWAGLSESFGQTRKLTSAGWGINTALDFPIRIISESGVFNFAGGYVFDDASSTNHKSFYSQINAPSDFLVRYDAQLHYSFAVNIDRDHFFRFRLGGTVYGIEAWADLPNQNNIDPQTGEPVIEFQRGGTETIGGISGKIEYMATNNSTPYGAGLQYFDEAILANAWLQVPITRTFAMRIDAKGFAPILRDPRAWENKTVFIPSVRAIYNF